MDVSRQIRDGWWHATILDYLPVLYILHIEATEYIGGKWGAVTSLPRSAFRTYAAWINAFQVSIAPDLVLPARWLLLDNQESKGAR